MNKELSAFAARLRQRFFVGDDVRSLHGGSQKSEPPHVVSYDDFNSLALELFALQFQLNPAYRKICQVRKMTPETAEHWTQIPAVPAGAFKELELSCIPPDERTAVFHSSGTTEQNPSRHFHCRESLEIYECSLWSWFEQNVLTDLRFANDDLRDSEKSALRAPHSALFLTPPPEQVPHSSLVHMFETVRRKLGGAGVLASRSGFLGQIDPGGAWTLDFDAVLATLNSAPVTRHPSLLLGTAFSFVQLADFLAEKNLRFNLPAGSRVMETGGYKNRSRSMPKAELHMLITERLGVPPENIICEYGMSELSSQAYTVTSDKWQVTRNRGTSCHLSSVTCHFQFPRWARVQIISPETGREVADGDTGLIRVFDLANVFSVMAIQTEDLGIRRGDGFELIGRAQLAEPRGCSLMTA
jgi:hypothetical protein